MPRAVEEWVATDAAERAPPRVRVRVFDAKGGRCHRCRRKLRPGDHWTLEHVKALINGGANRENNLDITCDWCLPEKNAEDVAEKSRVYSIRSKHVGAVEKRRRFGQWR